MAQHDDPMRRSFKSPKGGEPAVTIEYLFQVDDLNRQACTSPTLGKIQSPQEEDQEPQAKKSVLAKVKEKARKLKNSLSLKKHNREDNDNAAPTESEAGADVDRLNEVEERLEEEEEDAEYYGAPMYESEMAPKELKETARQHPREDVEISEKHVLVGRGEAITEGEKEEVTSKTISESVTEKLVAPAYAMATEATQMITSKIQDMAIATSKTLERKGSSAGEQIWDKGVSVKEYLMHKLEPGDDERALSQVITEVISPRNRAVDKAKGTVSSNFGKEEYSSTTLMSSPSTTATELNTATSSSSKTSNIPVSWNAYQEVEEENHEGRILQAN